MSWTLGIDSSTVELGVGLYNHNKPVCSFSRYVLNSHAEQIAQTVSFVLESNGLTGADIQRVGVAVGPGSFTGLRIGMAFLKGFFFQHRVKVLSISSLACVANSWSTRKGTLWVAFDARKNDVYAAQFSVKDGLVCRISDDRLISIEEFCPHIRAEDYILTDTLGYMKSSVFTHLPDNAQVFSLEDHAVQRGLACAKIASRESEESGNWISISDLTPRYIRLSAPEEKKKRLANS